MRATVLSILLAACGGGEAAAPPVQTVDPNVRLPIAAFRIIDDDSGLEMEVAEDGTLHIGHSRAGTFQTDGRFLNPDGQRMLLLASDGRLIDSEQNELPYSVGDDGTLTAQDGSAMRFDAQGRLTGAPDDVAELRLDPPMTPARRAAAIVLALYLLRNSGS